MPTVDLAARSNSKLRLALPLVFLSALPCHADCALYLTRHLQYLRMIVRLYEPRWRLESAVTRKVHGISRLGVEPDLRLRMRVAGAGARGRRR